MSVSTDPPLNWLFVDMNGYFASVEQHLRPELRGRPVGVIPVESEGSCVIAASSEAKRRGVKTGTGVRDARRLCPGIELVRARPDVYVRVHHGVAASIERWAPIHNAYSIDEWAIRLGRGQREPEAARELGRAIKRQIYSDFSPALACSIGIAPTRLLAKIASDLQKPDGLTIVPPDHVAEFLDPLPIGKLWGIGEVTEKLLVQCGVHTIGDLRCLAPAILEAKLGKHGVHLYQLAWGIEDSPVEPVHVTKSIGREETFPVDIIDKAHAWKEVLSLSIKTVKRLREEALQCGTITLKVKYNDFKQITRSVTLPVPTNDRRTVWNECRTLLQKTEVGTRPVRLLGIALSGLQPDTEPRQRSLFSSADTNALRDKNLNGALDHILDRFGENAIMPGTLLRK